MADLVLLKNDLAQMKALRFLVETTVTHAGDLDRDVVLRELDERITITTGAVILYEMPSDLPPSKARK